MTHIATIEWTRPVGENFTDQRYSRAHVWLFDGGLEVPASSSPHVVSAPFSVPENVDPEEAFVASLSSCHMLFYLSIAAKRGFVIDTYRDKAEGTLNKVASGRLAITHVALNPQVRYAGVSPDRATEAAIHHESHELYFIANSVKTVVETRMPQSVDLGT